MGGKRKRTSLSRFVPSVLQQSSSSPAASSELRTLRVERRDLARRLTVAEHRATVAEKNRDDSERRDLARRLTVAEQQRDDAVAELQEKKKQQDEEGVVLWDDGTELWQNIWHQEDNSPVLTFPTNKSVLCQSIETAHSYSSMPGVHTEACITRGKTTQSIWVKGVGYTLVGLVSSEEQKQHVRRSCAKHGWDKLPYMTTSYYGSSKDEGYVITIEVDMIEKCAKLFVSNKSDSLKQIKPKKVWTDLPDTVWIAIAFKRNSAREAVLMPCSIFNVTEEE